MACAHSVTDRLHGLRREYGRQNHAFETIVPVMAEPDAELFRRLEDMGVTGMVSFPLCGVLGPKSSLDQKRRVLERFADDVIAKC